MSAVSNPVLIDLDQPRPGYHHFISCWLHRVGMATLVVDPGPASTVDQLVEELRCHGVDRLDWILLTHIHLDHGGGTGQLCRAFPEARVVCYEPAAKHLIQPDRLWEGSLQVLGDKALLFGKPMSVLAERFAAPTELIELGIETIPTPGHAPHHQCYIHGDLLFAGEAAGMTCPGTASFYMRPATPPRFFLDVATASIDRLLARAVDLKRAAYAHYGLYEDVPELLAAARAQMISWVEVIDGLTAPGRRSWSVDLQQRTVARLLEIDPLFAPFKDLNDDLRSRELDFFRNTLEGMLGWLDYRDRC